MTENERRLLRLLIGLASAFALFLVLSGYASRRSELLRNIESLEREIPVLRGAERALPEYLSRIAELRAARPEGSESSRAANLYEFAGALAKRISSRGLSIARSTVTGTDEKAVLQLGVKGNVAALLAVAAEASGAEGLALLSMRLDANPSLVLAELELRIGYAER